MKAEPAPPDLNAPRPFSVASGRPFGRRPIVSRRGLPIAKQWPESPVLKLMPMPVESLGPACRPRSSAQHIVLRTAGCGRAWSSGLPASPSLSAAPHHVPRKTQPISLTRLLWPHLRFRSEYSGQVEQDNHEDRDAQKPGDDAFHCRFLPCWSKAERGLAAMVPAARGGRGSFMRPSHGAGLGPGACRKLLCVGNNRRPLA